MIIFDLRFSEDYYDKEAMVNFLICTRKIGDTFKNLTQLGQTEHGADAVCNYKQADMSAMFGNINIQNGKLPKEMPFCLSNSEGSFQSNLHVMIEDFHSQTSLTCLKQGMVAKMQTCIPDNVADNQISCLDHIIVRKQYILSFL